MHLKLLILLLLLVMHSSLSEKVDNHGIGDPTQRPDHVNFQKKALSRKASAYEGSTEYLNISTIMAPSNNRDRQVLVKKFLSDPDFKEFLNSERALNFLATLLMKNNLSIFEKAEKPDRKGKKLRTVSANELDGKEATVMNERKKNALSLAAMNPGRKNSPRLESLIERRIKRQAQQLWIQKDFQGYDEILNLYAFIIKDEEVPECGNTASKITNTRYFMCSGVILTERHVLTTASCIQYAHIFEHHITADLSVLIGAASSETYVLKIKKYEMHPEYKNNAELEDYALHNLAIITISCNIPKEVLVLPKLPRKFQDLSHMCCSNVCKLLTVIQTPNNRHEIKVLDVKYIPEAVHDDIDENDDFKKKRKRGPLVRKVKRENKAPPPVFFNQEPPKNTNTGTKNNTIKLANSTENELLEQITKDLMRGLFREKYQSNSRNLKTPDRQEIVRGFFRSNFETDSGESSKNHSPDLTENQTTGITNFIKVIVEKAMTRILGVLNEVKNKTNESLMEEEGENLVENIARTVKEQVLKEIEDSLTPKNLFNNTLAEPSSKYVHCPPLGTPVIVNNALISLVAYTCDDQQSWVPWKYVNIDRNLKWIKSIIGERTNNFDDSSKPLKDVDNDVPIFYKEEENENNLKYSEEDDDETLDTFEDLKDRFKKNDPTSLINADRFQKIKPILSNNFLQNIRKLLLLNNKSYQQKSISKRNDVHPRIAVNKCFLNEQNTLTCTRTFSRIN